MNAGQKANGLSPAYLGECSVCVCVCVSGGGGLDARARNGCVSGWCVVDTCVLISVIYVCMCVDE